MINQKSALLMLSQTITNKINQYYLLQKRRKREQKIDPQDIQNMRNNKDVISEMSASDIDMSVFNLDNESIVGSMINTSKHQLDCPKLRTASSMFMIESIKIRK